MNASGRVRRAGPVVGSAFATAAAVVLAGALFAGCTGKPVDPLAQDRARLMALEQLPLADDWPAEATVYVGPGLLKAQLDTALADATATAEESAAIETLLGQVRAVPRAHVDSVAFAPTATCAACVEVTVQVAGIVDAIITSPLGALRPKLPFTAGATATLELALVTDDKGRSVRLRAAPDGAWAVDATFETLPPGVSAALSDALAAHLERTVRAGLLPELPLMTLSQDEGLKLRGVRARPVPNGSGGHVVAVELAFVVLERGTTAQTPDPGEGFVLAIPDGTLLGIARASALRTPPADGFTAEPIAFTIDEDAFALDLRVWKLAAKPVAHVYRVHGRVLIAEGEVRIESERVELLQAPFDINPMALIERAAILHHLEREVNAALPARVEEDVALRRRVAVELVDARGEGGELIIEGRVSLLRPGS